MRDKLIAPILNVDPTMDTYRVLVQRTPDGFVFKVTEQLTRDFTADSLPECMAWKIGAIYANRPREPFPFTDKFLLSVTPAMFTMVVYGVGENVVPEGMEQIGWRLSESFLIVILSELDLIKLGAFDDARRARKKESLGGIEKVRLLLYYACHRWLRQLRRSRLLGLLQRKVCSD